MSKLVELKDLVGKKIKATKPNGNFVIGKLIALNGSHAEIEADTGETVLMPILFCEFKEAW